jgi:flavodoxin
MCPQHLGIVNYRKDVTGLAEQKPGAYEDIMKKFLLLALTFVCMEATMELYAQSQPGGKIIVTYFSWSGNAKALAEQIAQETGGNLFEIRTVSTYPDTYNECIEVAKQEQNRNARPALSGRVSNMAQYDTVFLCYPNLWGTLPMGVFTFLEAYDFSGKTIYPLVTHGGIRFGRSLDDIKKLSPRAVLGEGFSVSAFDTNPNDSTRVTRPNRDVSAWLRGLGVTN